MIFRRRKDRKKKPGIAEAGTLMPPEGVALKLAIAGVGVRLAAQITDVLITLVAMVCILLLMGLLKLTEPQTIFAVAMLLFFVIRVPYYAVSELAWNGQTLGKKLMKIKVVSHDGRSLSTHALVLRNLMKEAEVFLPGTLLLSLDDASPVASLIALGWVVMAFAIPLTNRYRMRLGDMMAGTHVIHLPQPILLKDLAAEKPVEAEKDFIFLSHQLDHYGAFELQTLEALLRAEGNPVTDSALQSRRRTLAAIVEKIRRKIGYAEPVPEHDHGRFLKAFYAAQRAHLEQRQLFGDRRADKHHATNGSETEGAE